LDTKPFKLLTFCVMLLLADALVLVGALWLLDQAHVGTASMPVITSIAVIEFLCTMAGISVVFSTAGVGTRDSALGLPDGSIRALLALSLLLLFGLLTMFLFNTIDGRSRHVVKGLPSTYTEDTVRQQHSSAVDISIKTEGQTKTAEWSEPASSSSVQFANTVLTLMGTLITAVTSFYFGTNSAIAVQSAVQKRPADPKPTGYEKNPVPRNPSGLTSVTVVGSSLNEIVSVELTSVDGAKKLVPSVQPKSNDGAVTFSIKDDAGIAGKWNIVLIDNKGVRISVPGPLEVI
jgi:energy-coupling factor transporter transmembrane protein EcfT